MPKCLPGKTFHRWDCKFQTRVLIMLMQAEHQAVDGFAPKQLSVFRRNICSDSILFDMYVRKRINFHIMQQNTIKQKMMRLIDEFFSLALTYNGPSQRCCNSNVNVLQHLQHTWFQDYQERDQ